LTSWKLAEYGVGENMFSYCEKYPDFLITIIELYRSKKIKNNI